MRAKTVKKSHFRGVSLVRDRYRNESWVCRGMINGINHFSKHNSERDAAKQWDIILITNNMTPVNIYRQQ